MQINKKITVLFIIFLAVIFLLPEIVSAQPADFGLNDLASSNLNLGQTDIKDIIVNIINIFLGFLGILAVLIILYGGFVWMTSQGNAEKIDKAKQILINGIIGLIIIISSYSIASFVLKEGLNGIFGGDPGGNRGNPGGVGLGVGALSSHYPARNAKNVPRNTNIYVTFSEPMNVEYIVDDPSCNVNCVVNSAFINLSINNDPSAVALSVNYSDDPDTGFRVFQFNPYGDSGDHLGSPNADVKYRMDLGALLTQNGQLAFPASSAYSWYFTVSTEMDLTPPTVQSVNPKDQTFDNVRNAIVQINFSEAIDPSLAQGIYNDGAGFTNINVKDNETGDLIEGEYLIANQYKTVEFITEDLCGQNSCGGDVFCLPFSSALEGIVDGTGTVLDGDVIADMAGNILDGDNDAISGGDYQWNFGTADVLDLTPPIITAISDWTDAPINAPIVVDFDKNLLTSSIFPTIDYDTGGVDTGSVELTQYVDSKGIPVNYWMTVNDNILQINHDNFSSNTSIDMRIWAILKDINQNCFYPSNCQSDTGQCVANNFAGDNTCSGSTCSGIKF